VQESLRDFGMGPRRIRINDGILMQNLNGYSQTNENVNTSMVSGKITRDVITFRHCTHIRFETASLFIWYLPLIHDANPYPVHEQYELVLSPAFLWLGACPTTVASTSTKEYHSVVTVH
jgi:hypothetical protein